MVKNFAHVLSTFSSEIRNSTLHMLSIAKGQVIEQLSQFSTKFLANSEVLFKSQYCTYFRLKN